MAAKPQAKKGAKAPTKARPKTVARKPAAAAKLHIIKSKPKAAVAKPKTAGAAAAKKTSAKPRPHVSRRPTPKTARKVERSAAKGTSRTASAPQPAVAPAPKVISKQFAGAVHAYEGGIKLMYAEDYAKAIQKFNDLIANYPDEPEIQASAKARIHACENKLQERARTIYRSADDHYNIAVALLNSGDHKGAVDHLQQALKLSPKADHILYALAAANALLGNRDQAVTYLKQSIHYRPENRFQAAQDNDFNALAEDAAFRDLVAPPEK